MKKNGLRIIALFYFVIYQGNIVAQEAKIVDEDVENIVGIFDGYIEELNTYDFIVEYELDVNILEESYNFVMKNKELETKYDLKTEKLLGKSFEISYTVHVETELNDEGIEDFYEIYTIIDLKLIE